VLKIVTDLFADNVPFEKLAELVLRVIRFLERRGRYGRKMALILLEIHLS
jgi:hypothetical protein